MTPNHIESWRNYLAGQLKERYEVVEDKAHRMATEWIESLDEVGPSDEKRSATSDQKLVDFE